MFVYLSCKYNNLNNVTCVANKLASSYSRLMEPNGHRRVRRKDVLENGDMGQSNTGDELDPWTAWAYKPRTISMLIIGACFLM